MTDQFIPEETAELAKARLILIRTFKSCKFNPSGDVEIEDEDRRDIYIVNADPCASIRFGSGFSYDTWSTDQLLAIAEYAKALEEAPEYHP